MGQNFVLISVYRPRFERLVFYLQDSLIFKKGIHPVFSSVFSLGVLFLCLEVFLLLFVFNKKLRTYIRATRNRLCFTDVDDVRISDFFSFLSNNCFPQRY